MLPRSPVHRTPSLHPSRSSVRRYLASTTTCERVWVKRSWTLIKDEQTPTEISPPSKPRWKKMRNCDTRRFVFKSHSNEVEALSLLIV
jgi:hypothetical protein